MRRLSFFARTLAVMAALVSIIGATMPAYARNKVLGGIEFVLPAKDLKNAGVWVDGRYVGYIAELKGSRELLMVPGEHEISIRQAGYTEFDQKVSIEPGKRAKLYVIMKKDPAVQYAKVTSQVKLEVEPDRAAVFVDGVFAGSVREFTGLGRAMLLNPGQHTIKVAMPGYQPFTTQMNLLPNQKYTIKTKLIAGSEPQEGTALKHP